MQVQWDQIISYYLLYSLGGLAILLTLLHMLYRRRSATSITAWLLLMIIAPYFFVLFYFLFGIRKRSFDKEKSPMPLHGQDKDRSVLHPIDTLLRGNGVPPSSNDNALTLYTDSVQAYKEFFDALRGAEHSISLSTYILNNDTLTAELFDLLIEKAKAGVNVRILTDAFGSIGIYLWRRPLKRLEAAGVRISFFMPLFTLPFQNRLNLRYHRKIYLIDNTILFSGGMNLAQEYMGPVIVQGQWTDLLYRTQGSAVEHYINIFESDWAFARRQPAKSTPVPPLCKKGQAKLQVIPSGPDVIDDALLEAVIYGIYNASERVWIVSAYFIPNESILQALHIARHRGVDVKIVIPKVSSHLIENLGRSSYIRELQESGIDVFFYKGPKLHAKLILLDSDAVILGSVNLDNRSLLLNYEVATIAYSKEQIDQMDEWIRKLLQNSSTQIGPASKIRRVSENLMRIFALQL